MAAPRVDSQRSCIDAEFAQDEAPLALAAGADRAINGVPLDGWDSVLGGMA